MIMVIEIIIKYWSSQNFKWILNWSFQIHFLISISANYTHLKDDRFSTLNAYEAEEVRNSKHSVVDTSMWLAPGANSEESTTPKEQFPETTL